MDLLADIQRRGFDEYREYINPFIALRARLSGEPVKVRAGGDGSLRDTDDRVIEDFHGAQSFGHRHPAIGAALRDFLESDAASWYPSRVNPFAGRLARVLCERTGYSNAWFGSSGSDVVEAALKLARAATGRTRFLGLEKAYHGTTMGSCALMAAGPYRDLFAPHVPGVQALPRNDVAALQAALADGDVAGVIVEPIQLEGGVHTLTDEYVAALCELTEHHGALLFADEVQSGLGRTGRLLKSETWPRRPDGALLAKALGGGLMPISVMLTRRALFERAYGRSFELAEAHNQTFSGNAACCVAALATLELLDDDAMARAREVGDRFRANLAAALEGSVGFDHVRGEGLIVGLVLAHLDHPWLSFEHFGMPELSGRPSIGLLLCHRMYRQGFYLFVCGHDWTVLRLQPRLDIPEATLDRFCVAVREELDKLGELA